jgi:WD40 repeat protein
MMAILKSNADKKAFIVWDLEQNREIVTSTEHTNNIVSIAFSPDDSALASCGSDGMIKLWDVS